MPIYEYTCQHCQNRFEKLTYNGHTQVECPQCQSGEVRRVPSVFSSTVAQDWSPPTGGGCQRCGADSPGQCQFN